MSDVVLSYGDALLRKAEIELLSGNGWLNDQIIGFAFEYIQNVACKDLSEQVVLIGPEVTQFVKLVSKDEISSILGSMNLQDKDLIIFALNSMQDADRAGGSHWSLLVYSKWKNKWLHFDSCKGYNHVEANSLAAKVSTCLNSQSSKVPPLVNVDCLQQKNGYDCGCFLIQHAQHIVQLYSQNRTFEEIPKLKEDTVKGFRKEFLNLISSLKDT
eukprot:TRINITY_DN1074_c0_g1_i3.p1 TRINITY_DN1074_c0_g1~~TRINITY_DN1074_c0_g1_i3.p1  ORF type:complete len:214 (+),score=18.53 TRINITY_DN1074_c0_g1_i3:178-819(+)